MSKAKKTRAKEYDEKLSIDGSFEDVIKLSLTPTKTDIVQQEDKEVVFNLIGGSKVRVLKLYDQIDKLNRFDFIIEHPNGLNESFIYSPESTTTTDQIGSIYQQEALKIFLSKYS